MSLEGYCHESEFWMTDNGSLVMILNSDASLGRGEVKDVGNRVECLKAMPFITLSVRNPLIRASNFSAQK